MCLQHLTSPFGHGIVVSWRCKIKPESPQPSMESWLVTVSLIAILRQLFWPIFVVLCWLARVEQYRSCLFVQHVLLKLLQYLLLFSLSFLFAAFSSPRFLSPKSPALTNTFLKSKSSACSAFRFWMCTIAVSVLGNGDHWDLKLKTGHMCFWSFWSFWSVQHL